MKITNLRGVIIKETQVGEADKIITLLTNEMGKFSAVAPGARRSNSRLLGGTQLLSYVEYNMFPSKNLAKVNHAEVIESFYEIRKDLIKLTYATYMLEMVEEIALEGIRNEPLLRLLLNTLYVLAKKERDPSFISTVFEIRIMCIAGYMPNVMQCVHCGEQSLEKDLRFSSILGGVICAKCKQEDSYANKISLGALHSLQYIIYSDLKQIFNFQVSNQVLKELKALMKNYIRFHLDKSFKTLEFLEMLET